MQAEALPLMHPDEIAVLESLVGRPLSNEEAWTLLTDAILDAAFNVWAEARAREIDDVEVTP